MDTDKVDELDLATYPVDRLNDWFEKFRLDEQPG